MGWCERAGIWSWGMTLNWETGCFCQPPGKGRMGFHLSLGSVSLAGWGWCHCFVSQIGWELCLCSLCSVFQFPFSMLRGWQYIAFPLPQCSNTLTNYIIHCFLPQSNSLMKFWRTLAPRKGWTQCAVEVVNIQWHLLFSAKTWVIPGKLIASMLAKARVLAPLFKKRFARELISQSLTGPAGCSSRALGLGSSSGFRGSAFSSAYMVVRA